MSTSTMARKRDIFTAATLIIIFGPNKDPVVWPVDQIMVRHDCEIGPDIFEHMMQTESVPQWEPQPQSRSGAQALDLGMPKMKQRDWSKVIKGSFQTCLWMGVARSNRTNQQNERAFASGKGRVGQGDTTTRSRGGKSATSKGKGKQRQSRVAFCFAWLCSGVCGARSLLLVQRQRPKGQRLSVLVILILSTAVAGERVWLGFGASLCAMAPSS